MKSLEIWIRHLSLFYDNSLYWINRWMRIYPMKIGFYMNERSLIIERMFPA